MYLNRHRVAYSFNQPIVALYGAAGADVSITDNQRHKTKHKVGKGLFAASQEHSILLSLLQDWYQSTGLLNGWHMFMHRKVGSLSILSLCLINLG
jgi:hypothetical protein